jgi:L-ascorbate metabolism protein UlaG (beta-lactamase superfamily)
MYGVNLAVIHADGQFTMGQEEGAFAVLNLIKPRTVIPEHMNQVSTAGGAVVAGTRVERLIELLQAPIRQFPPSRPPKVIIPRSGVPISCNGTGNCTQ